MFSVACIRVLLSVTALLSALTPMVESSKVFFTLPPRPEDSKTCCKSCAETKKWRFGEKKKHVGLAFGREYGHYYLRLYENREWWYVANAVCIASGGLLALPRNKDEVKTVKRYIDQATSSKKARFFHVGFYQKRFGSKKWVDMKGKPLSTYKHLTWKPGEPNNGDGYEYCGSIDHSVRMNDVQCSNVRAPFLCEIRTG